MTMVDTVSQNLINKTLSPIYVHADNCSKIINSFVLIVYKEIQVNMFKGKHKERERERGGERKRETQKKNEKRNEIERLNKSRKRIYY